MPETGMEAPRHCTFSARLDCHYLLRVPDVIDQRTALVVALHGFAQSAEIMLPLAVKLFGTRHAIAALQGPNQFFLNNQNLDVGYCWNTNRQTASSIRLHHDMVQHVFNAEGRELGIPPGRRILMGFSQPVALNYRFSATHPDAVRGIVAVCGGIPGDWETADYLPVKASILHIARREDEYYSPQVTEKYPRRLGLRAPDVEFQLIDGAHRMPSRGHAIVGPWLDRIIR